MKTFVLNGKMLRCKEQAHPYLARMLDLPDYYGNNLDALYDCLTELGPCVLILVNAGPLRQEHGYGERVLNTLEDAARQTPGLRLILDGEDGRP